MKKTLPFSRKKRAVAAGGLVLFLAAITGSSFVMPGDPPAKTPAACSGPFYTTNALGANFSVLSPGTGAPDNSGTCARSGCHTTYADNSGAGILTIDVGGGITEYMPGQTYTVKVTLTETGITAMNFQLTVRDGASTSKASGTLSITESTRTKLTNGSFGGGGSKYIEGTACGIDVTSPGYNEWSFNWKAPAVGTGDVTFYLGALSANFNNQNTGDYPYSKQLMLTEKPTVGIKKYALSNAGFKIYPNPAANYFTIDYTVPEEAIVTIKLVDLHGKEVAGLFNKKQPAGSYTQKFENDDRYAPGIYFIRAVAGNDAVIGSGIIRIGN